MTKPKPDAKHPNGVVCYCARWDVLVHRIDAAIRPKSCPTFKLDQRYWTSFAFDAALGQFVSTLSKPHTPKARRGPSCIHCYNSKPAPYWLKKQFRESSPEGELSEGPQPQALTASRSEPVD